MKKLWILAGRMAFWLSWPLLWIYLAIQPPRTRVVIEHDGKALLVKGWLGSGNWTLPGGGLHKGEDELKGAIREVHEETGILLSGDDLKPLSEGWISHHGLRYRYKSFGAQLQEPADITPQRYEIVDIQWLTISSLLGSPNIPHDVKQILVSWRKLA